MDAHFAGVRNVRWGRIFGEQASGHACQCPRLCARQEADGLPIGSPGFWHPPLAMPDEKPRALNRTTALQIRSPARSSGYLLVFIEPRACGCVILQAEMAATKLLVTRSDEVMSGAVVFAGTRVPVQTLLDYLEEGDRLDDFLEDFPTVSREHALAVLEFAKQSVFAHADSSG